MAVTIAILKKSFTFCAVKCESIYTNISKTEVVYIAITWWERILLE